MHISNQLQVTNLTQNDAGHLFLKATGFSNSLALLQFYEEEHHIYFKIYDEVYKHSMFVDEYPCSDGLDWNTVSQACEAIDCTTKENTLSTTSSSSTCDCAVGFIWDEPNKKCLRDCSTDAGSTKVSLPNLQCECLLYHSWDPNNLECRPHCNRNLAIGVNATDPYRC